MDPRYVERFLAILEDDKMALFQGVDPLKQTLEGLLSLENGLAVANTARHYLNLEEAHEDLRTADLLCLSLVRHVPAGSRFDGYLFNKSGISFSLPGGRKIVDYREEIRTILDSTIQVVEKTRDEVIDETRSIYLFFKNDRFGMDWMHSHRQKTPSWDLVEITTGDDVSPIINAVAARTVDPEKVMAMRSGGLCFSMNGMILLRTDGVTEIVPYSEECEREVERHLKKYHDVMRRSRPSTIKIRKNVLDYFLSNLDSAIHDVIGRLPVSDISPSERLAADLEKELGIMINHDKMDVEGRRLVSRFSLDELAIAGQFFRQVRDVGGKRILCIEKGAPPKDYDGTVKTARKHVVRAHSHIHDLSEEGLDLWRLIAKLSPEKTHTFEIDAPTLAVLGHDFQRYFPIVLGFLARDIYTFLPDGIVTEYEMISRPDLERQGEVFRLAGKNLERMIPGLAKLDFINSSTRYQLARIRGIRTGLSSEREGFFDRIYGPALVSGDPG